MKKQFKNIGFFLLALIMSVISLSSCENETWNQHYQVDNKIASNKTLWETIKGNSNLTEFAWAVRVSGYDKILSSSQMFTVWAPTNSVLNIDTTQLSPDSLVITKQFVENHISRYSYSASGTFDKRIVLLNKKITRFKSNGAEFSFAGIKLVEINSISNNGVLHVVENPFKFFPNIWEYLATNRDLDSIKNYLYSFNVITFDPTKSVPGDVNEEGNIVYLDSVKYNNNMMFRILGRLNNEDSSYVAILPTNTAWIKSYANISNYYKYYYNPLKPLVVPSKITADTLQRKYTALSLVRDLVFSKSMQAAPNDSLTSTSLNTFLKPQYLFAGLQQQTTSNGSYYLCDELKYNHYESWNKELRVEAERSTGRKFDWANIFERSYMGDDSIVVSKYRYIEVTSVSTAIPPSVTFDIPNTLSGKLNADKTIMYGASYNIYCVFLPTFIKDNTRRPAKVSFNLFYTRADGKVTTITTNPETVFDNNKLFFQTNKDMITKLLVASNVSFPYCEFGFELPTVKLKVLSNAKASESVSFTRDLLIDCIILEPVH